MEDFEALKASLDPAAQKQLDQVCNTFLAKAKTSYLSPESTPAKRRIPSWA